MTRAPLEASAAVAPVPTSAVFTAAARPAASYVPAAMVAVRAAPLTTRVMVLLVPLISVLAPSAAVPAFVAAADAWVTFRSTLPTPRPVPERTVPMPSLLTPVATAMVAARVTGAEAAATVPSDRRPWAWASRPTVMVSEPAVADADTEALSTSGADTLAENRSNVETFESLAAARRNASTLERIRSMACDDVVAASLRVVSWLSGRRSICIKLLTIWSASRPAISMVCSFRSGQLFRCSVAKRVGAGKRNGRPRDRDRPFRPLRVAGPGMVQVRAPSP